MSDRLEETIWEGEEWRPIPGWEGLYSASSLGRIRRDAHTTPTGGTRVTSYPERIRKPILDQAGYYRLSMKKKGRVYGRFVHRLVLAAFYGDRPTLETRHLDGDPKNNAIHNLAWGTGKDNAQDRERHRTQIRGDTCPHAKLTEDAVRFIRNSEITSKTLSVLFDVDISTLCKARKGTTWKHVD